MKLVKKASIDISCSRIGMINTGVIKDNPPPLGISEVELKVRLRFICKAFAEGEHDKAEALVHELCEALGLLVGGFG